MKTCAWLILCVKIFTSLIFLEGITILPYAQNGALTVSINVNLGGVYIGQITKS